MEELGLSKNKELKKFSDMHRYYIFKYTDTSIIDSEFSTKTECMEYMQNEVNIDKTPDKPIINIYWHQVIYTSYNNT